MRLVLHHERLAVGQRGVGLEHDRGAGVLDDVRHLGAEKRVLTGTATAPASNVPQKPRHQSRPLGSRFATRSPGRTPAARRPPATRAARSQTCG